MDPKYALISLVIRTAWAALGVLLGVYALIRARKAVRTTAFTGKYRWWFQIVATPVTALFVLWIIMAFRGFAVQLPWQALLVLLPLSLLALPNAFWLLYETSKDLRITTAST
jgi:hypothetical protein